MFELNSFVLKGPTGEKPATPKIRTGPDSEPLILTPGHNRSAALRTSETEGSADPDTLCVFRRASPMFRNGTRVAGLQSVSGELRSCSVQWSNQVLNLFSSQRVYDSKVLRLSVHLSQNFMAKTKQDKVNSAGKVPSSWFLQRRKVVPSKVKNWICYGKKTSPESKEKSETETPFASSEISVTKMIYDQQNMIKCFEERNFYRLLFVFFQSLVSPLGGKIETKNTENETPDPTDELEKDAGEWSSQSERAFPGASGHIRESRLARRDQGRTLTLLGSFTEHHWNAEYTRWRSRKFILFGRSEIKRLFRKVLFMKSESLLFAQIFLIPLAAFFGVLYTFWTFSVSSTVTGKEYVPIAQQQQLQKFSPFTVPIPPTRQDFIRQVSVGHSGKEGIFSRNLLFDITQKIQESWSKIGTHTSREVFFSTGEGNLSFDSSPEDLIEFEEQQSMKFTPFFTSYKVDWSPTPGLADFLRFTNSASKIFMMWASLAVLRSLRPVKANRPELQIQTRFLRPFQNRKRFRDLEGIEKFSGVLTTLTESLQGSFKDPLFYLALILPNLPFFQPFQKGIGKFRFFLFYGKQTVFLRKSITLFINILFPQERQKQSQSFPKGYLFIGPPGTGKTLLAQAIAGESKVNFICLSASEIQKQVDIGTRIGALRLRNLFEEARTSTPCILFFDEIDTLGRARFDSAAARKSQKADLRWLSTSSGPQTAASRSFRSQSGSKQKSASRTKGLVGNRQRSGFPSHDTSSKKGSENGSKNSGLPQEIDLKLFTEFLVQMDSFSVKDGFLVIGTTNFLSSLDPAFVRSGRFDRILGLSYPPKQTRIAILKLHIQKKGNFFDSKLSWNIFGLKTKDLSPADLAKIVNESSLYLINQLNELRPASDSPTESLSPLETFGSWPQETRSVFHVLSAPMNFVFNTVGLLVNVNKSFWSFKPGLTHTSQSLREGFVKILESKK